MLVFIGEAFEKIRPSTIAWTPELNQRRIDLIDRDVVNSLSFDERVELAHLTNALRTTVNTEDNFPMAGARDLHAKLKALKQKEDQN